MQGLLQILIIKQSYFQLLFFCQGEIQASCRLMRQKESSPGCLFRLRDSILFKKMIFDNILMSKVLEELNAVIAEIPRARKNWKINRQVQFRNDTQTRQVIGIEKAEINFGPIIFKSESRMLNYETNLSIYPLDFVKWSFWESFIVCNCSRVQFSPSVTLYEGKNCTASTSVSHGTMQVSACPNTYIQIGEDLKQASYYFILY